ncbi:hypothetical protein CIB48_g1985 [Xylaria polymorpha]|nr:hypothetical protein CIB48_g1985 [Xylaria polymorpha]
MSPDNGENDYPGLIYLDKFYGEQMYSEPSASNPNSPYAQGLYTELPPGSLDILDVTDERYTDLSAGSVDTPYAEDVANEYEVRYNSAVNDENAGNDADVIDFDTLMTQEGFGDGWTAELEAMMQKEVQELLETMRNSTVGQETNPNSEGKGEIHN